MIAKETFVSAIESMQQQLFNDQKSAELLKEAVGVQVPFSDNSLLFNTICDLLNIWFPKGDNCPIRHYCFQLDFGHVSEEDYISPEDFYDDLILQHYPLLHGQ